MNWLTDTKIPVGDYADRAFTWLEINAAFFFDAMSDGLEALIAGILWVLQSPHPLVVIGAFVALTLLVQRSWKPALLVGLGFLFIVNQGYWEQTTQSLTLVLAACVVCMGLGVPILRLSHSRHCLFRHRHGARPDRHGDLRAARTDPPDPSGHHRHPHRLA
jgi:glycine betaine/proline transport system permease protein